MKWRCKSVRRQMFRSILRISKQRKAAMGKRWPRKSKVGNQWAALDKWSHYGQTFKPVSMTSSSRKVCPRAVLIFLSTALFAVVVQSLCCVPLSVTLWTEAHQASLSFTIFSSAFNLSHHQGLFQWVSSFHQVAKVLELQLWHISPFNEYSTLV